MYTLSSVSNRSLGAVSEANKDGLRLLQLYLSSNWELNMAMLRLAEKYGFTGVVITVDTKILGVRTK